ncbi:membrane-bound ClpP family serine protease [Kroppenstedtia sanguinis]|uniref:LiaF transmembrane domain-containing protein n=1 Tax=Kroppenstedtia sanguinis TaxID=1380684 RepID=A0ABW4C7P3_9BACL
MRTKTIGLLIVLAGIFLLLREQGIELSLDTLSWELILALAGLLMIFFSRHKPRHSYGMIWGGIALGLGVHAWGMKQIKDWPAHWSMFPAIIGASLLIFGGLLRKNRSHGTIGALLLLLGLFAWPGVTEIPGLHPIAQFLNSYWPGILVILGTYMAFKK